MLASYNSLFCLTLAMSGCRLHFESLIVIICTDLHGSMAGGDGDADAGGAVTLRHHVHRHLGVREHGVMVQLRVVAPDS